MTVCVQKTNNVRLLLVKLCPSRPHQPISMFRRCRKAVSGVILNRVPQIKQIPATLIWIEGFSQMKMEGLCTAFKQSSKETPCFIYSLQTCHCCCVYLILNAYWMQKNKTGSGHGYWQLLTLFHYAHQICILQIKRKNKHSNNTCQPQH